MLYKLRALVIELLATGATEDAFMHIEGVKLLLSIVIHVWLGVANKFSLQEIWWLSLRFSRDESSISGVRGCF